MRDNKAKRNTLPKTSARDPAARQGAAKPVSLAERREKAVIKLPEERRKGTKYQVIRGQYLRQANKKENLDKTQTAAIKTAAAKQEEKQEKAKYQTAAAKTVRDEKRKDKISSPKNVLPENNEAKNVVEAKEKYAAAVKAEEYTERLQTNIDLSKAQNEYARTVKAEEYTEQLQTNIDLSAPKDKYIRSVKAAEYSERLQTNIDLSKAVSIPPSVTWEQVIDNAIKKDTVYDKDGTAQERAQQYKEKVNFYLNKMKKNSETDHKEEKPNSDKDIRNLYKKAHKLARKEDLLEKKTETLFDKAQSAMQLKSEIDNAVNKDNTGEAVMTAAAIPITHSVTKAVRKLADRSPAVNAGKVGIELAAKITSEIAAADGVGEAAVNAALAVPKYAVEKKIEKTVQQVMQKQHDRKIAAQRERLRQKQEKVEKRALQMKKENIQRNMKTEFYKSEHGITSNGNNILKNANAAVKNALEAMKRAISSFKSSIALVTAAAGGSLIVFLAVALVIFIVLLFVLFPFFYTSKNGREEEIMESEFLDTIQHYYTIMDSVVDKFNAKIDKILCVSDYDNTGVENPEKKAKYDADYAAYKEQCEDLEKASKDITGEATRAYIAKYGYHFFPKEPEKDYYYTYDELKNDGMERGPIFEGFEESDESDASRVPKGQLYDEMLCTIATNNAKQMTNGGGDIIFMNDKNVEAVYGGSGFWDFDHWKENVDCPVHGNCCSKIVPVEHVDSKGNVTITYEEVTYCPTHYIIVWEVQLDFDLDRIWDSYNFDDEDKKTYKETKKEFDNEKGIT